jgi:hypothetical protein
MPTKAISFKPTGGEKRPRGRPPKSKSSTNEDEQTEPHEYINTALAASQPTTIDPAQLSAKSTTFTWPGSTGRYAQRSGTASP